MTLEERAKKTCDNFYSVGYLAALKLAFHALIEECAMVADDEAEKEQTYSNDLGIIGTTSKGVMALKIAANIRKLAEEKP